MRRSLGSWRCRYWLVLPLDPEFRFDAPRPDGLLARQQVAGLASDTFNLHAMRSFLVEAFRLDVHRMDDRQVVDTLAELLGDGRVQLVEEELERSPATAWDFPARAPTAPQAQRSRRVAASGHPEPHVRIVDVQDARGRSVKGGGRAYDPKRAGVRGSKKTRFVVRLEQQEADLQLQILPASGNRVGREYYRGGIVRDFWLRGATPGEHTFEWDGRGVVDGERYILQGEYTVQLNAACARCRALAQDRTTIEVARPRAYLYEPKNIRWVAHYLKTGLGQLSDGSGFDTATDVDADAHQALAKMPDAAIWVFSGHGSIGGPWFEHVSKRATYLVGEAPEGHRQPMNAVVEDLPGNALEDVFLVLMLCCYTAQYHALAESLVAKGADLVIGFCEDLNLNAYPKWIRGFLAALENGKSIGEAILAGIDMVDDDDKPALSSFRVFNGPGASANDKLLPARYGRKSGTRQVS